MRPEHKREGTRQRAHHRVQLPHARRHKRGAAASKTAVSACTGLHWEGLPRSVWSDIFVTSYLGVQLPHARRHEGAVAVCHECRAAEFRSLQNPRERVRQSVHRLRCAGKTQRHVRRFCQHHRVARRSGRQHPHEAQVWHLQRESTNSNEMTVQQAARSPIREPCAVPWAALRGGAALESPEPAQTAGTESAETART